MRCSDGPGDGRLRRQELQRHLRSKKQSSELPPGVARLRARTPACCPVSPPKTLPCRPGAGAPGERRGTDPLVTVAAPTRRGCWDTRLRPFPTGRKPAPTRPASVWVQPVQDSHSYWGAGELLIHRPGAPLPAAPYHVEGAAPSLSGPLFLVPPIFLEEKTKQKCVLSYSLFCAAICSLLRPRLPLEIAPLAQDAASALPRGGEPRFQERRRRWGRPRQREDAQESLGEPSGNPQTGLAPSVPSGRAGGRPARRQPASPPGKDAIPGHKEQQKKLYTHMGRGRFLLV